LFREREKAEQRDRKVLEILEKKDERIEELQTNLAYNTRELGENVIRYAQINHRINDLMSAFFFLVLTIFYINVNLSSGPHFILV